MHLATRCTAALALSMALLTQASAQSTSLPDNPLLAHARQQDDALRFQIGKTSYQVVPDAILVPRTNEASETQTRKASSAASSSGTVVATLGPYAITLQDGSARRLANPASIDTAREAVVVNLRSGQPALLKPQLALHTNAAGQGKALARALGASLVFDGTASQIVILQFDSILAALAALPQARSLDGISHAQPVLQHDFKTQR